MVPAGTLAVAVQTTRVLWPSVRLATVADTVSFSLTGLDGRARTEITIELSDEPIEFEPMHLKMAGMLVLHTDTGIETLRELTR